jgi:hypothetical protein
LYYDGVIEVIPAYKYKNFFGALIVACPPFNLLVFPFLPFFACNHKKQKLRRLNNVLVKFIFMPFALIYACIFTIFNLLMMPFAYLKTCYEKGKQIFIDDSPDAEQQQKPLRKFLFYLLLGIPLLLATQITDIYYFIIHLY